MTKIDVKKASEWIRSNNHFADTLLVHPFQQIKLIEHQELIEAWRFGSIAEQKGKHFCEMTDALNTYWVSVIGKGVALIYEKSECCLRRTPLRVRFDDPANPKQLIVEEDRIAWFTDKTAAAKIRFQLV